MVVIMLPSSVPIGFMESQLYFNCGCREAKFYSEVIVITGAQPKAGTGHKIQSISVVFSTLHCEARDISPT